MPAALKETGQCVLIVSSLQTVSETGLENDSVKLFIHLSRCTVSSVAILCKARGEDCC